MPRRLSTANGATRSDLEAAAVASQSADADLTARRRRQIVSAAVHLFSRKGYYGTTMQDIARRAKMSAGLIYHYAETKEGVLLLALLHVIDTYQEQVPPMLEGLTDPLDRFSAVHAGFCRVVADNIDATILVYRSTNSLPPDKREIVKQGELETSAMIARAIQDCIDATLFRKLDVELATYQVLMNVHAWALKNWRFKGRYDIGGYIADGFDMLVRGFATPEGLTRHLERRGRASA